MAVTFNFPGFIPQNTRQQFYYHLRNHFSKNYLYISNIKLIIIKGKIEFVHLKQIQQFRILNSIQNNRSSQQKVLFIYFLDSLFYISFFVPVVSIFRVKIAPSSQSLSFRSLSQFAVHMSHIMVGLQLLLLPDCLFQNFLQPSACRYSSDVSMPSQCTIFSNSCYCLSSIWPVCYLVPYSCSTFSSFRLSCTFFSM